MSNVRADARMALARYESSVAAFGMEAGFPMKDVRAVQEYIEKLETALQRANANVEEYERKFYLGTDRIEKLEAALQEPTLPMLLAGKKSLYSCSEDPEIEDARACFLAMARKALEGKDG